MDDAERLKGRVSEETWNAEMLCARPVRSDLVLPEFERGVHVVEGSAVPAASQGGEAVCVAGMDFGIRAPTVVLWAWLRGDASLTVFAERVVAGEVLEAHIEAIRRGDGAGGVVPAWIGIDPAGGQRNMQTGLSDAAQMRRAGLTVRDRRMPLHAGLELVRTRLRPAAGSARLFVDARCEKLIESLERYRYSTDRPESTEPVKDGSDHAVDALRYLVQNIDAGYRSEMANYL